jgi:hypothetical protein
MLKMGVPVYKSLYGDFSFLISPIQFLTSKNSPGGFAVKTSIGIEPIIDERNPMDEAIQIPVYLYQVMYTVFSSAIPILIILVIVGWVIKLGKKTIRSFTD